MLYSVGDNEIKGSSKVWDYSRNITDDMKENNIEKLIAWGLNPDNPYSPTRNN
jgi:hypothetical protein